MRTRRIEPGRYEATHGRGRSRRTFLIEQKLAGDPDGYPAGWMTTETGIAVGEITDGYTVHAWGLGTKAGAVRVAEAEVA